MINSTFCFLSPATSSLYKLEINDPKTFLSYFHDWKVSPRFFFFGCSLSSRESCPHGTLTPHRIPAKFVVRTLFLPSQPKRRKLLLLERGSQRKSKKREKFISLSLDDSLESLLNSGEIFPPPQCLLMKPENPSAFNRGRSSFVVRITMLVYRKNNSIRYPRFLNRKFSPFNLSEGKFNEF